MGNVVEIDSDELDALRQQAAAAIIWPAEAVRLAEAIHRIDPEHKLLRGEPWVKHFEDKEEARKKGYGYAPDRAGMAAIVEATPPGVIRG